MTEFIELLRSKLESESKSNTEQINFRLQNEFGCDLTAESEVGIFLQMVNEGQHPKEEVYSFLYKFTEFYEQDDEYLADFANIIVFAVSEELLDAIDGSRLIGSIWGNLGYPNELVEFIGTEGEVEYLDNRLKEQEITENDKQEINNKLNEIRAKLKYLASNYIRNNTI